MTDWSGALARAFHNHLKFSGSSGSSGSGDENSNVVSALSEQAPGTTPKMNWFQTLSSKIGRQIRALADLEPLEPLEPLPSR